MDIYRVGSTVISASWFDGSLRVLRVTARAEQWGSAGFWGVILKGTDAGNVVWNSDASIR